MISRKTVLAKSFCIPVTNDQRQLGDVAFLSKTFFLNVTLHTYVFSRSLATDVLQCPMAWRNLQQCIVSRKLLPLYIVLLLSEPLFLVFTPVHAAQLCLFYERNRFRAR